MRVLVVEDDALLGDAIQAGLRQQGFVADWVRDGVAADLALESGTHEAVVLDIGLPRRSGLERHRRRRDAPPKVKSQDDDRETEARDGAVRGPATAPAGNGAEKEHAGKEDPRRVAEGRAPLVGR